MTCPKLGILAYRPIQYHAPLYQRLAEREVVEIDVLFLSDAGQRAVVDPGFGIEFNWDIDLTSGYRTQVLTSPERPRTVLAKMARVNRWIGACDAVIIHGHASPWMLLAMLICRIRGIPYLLRGASHARSYATGIRRMARHSVARVAVSLSACALPVGKLSEEFFRRYGAHKMVLAPNSVDDCRFSRQPAIGRGELLSRWSLNPTDPVVIFSGKLIPRKRPLDLVMALRELSQPASVIFVGDGVLASQVAAALDPRKGAVVGFVNQSELPSYYHAADILVLPSEKEMWGLVINEAMAAGVFPVASDQVGAVPDLVAGVGEVYACGDVQDLADALRRALQQIKAPGIRERMREHASSYSLEATATAYERAALAVCHRSEQSQMTFAPDET